MEKLLDGLIKNTKLALVVIGLFLILIGAAGGFAKLSLKIEEPGWRIALFLMGAVVAGFGALLIWRSGKEDSVSSTLVKDCGLKITWPLSGTVIDGHIKVVGIFQKIPPEDRIWLLERSLTTGFYYFKGRLIFESERWSADYAVGGESGSERILYVVAAGKTGKALADYYFKVAKEAGRWVGIETITPDILFFDNVKLKRK